MHEEWIMFRPPIKVPKMEEDAPDGIISLRDSDE